MEFFSLNYYIRIRGSVIISVGNKSFMLILLLGTKVPGDESSENVSSTYGTFVFGNESFRVQNFHESATALDRLHVHLKIVLLENNSV